MNIYIASHAHHIESVSAKYLTETLYKHALQPKYVVSIPWGNDGDILLSDNTCVVHRSTEGSFEGKYKRGKCGLDLWQRHNLLTVILDMRRATVHDDSFQAWGLNDRTAERMGYRWFMKHLLLATRCLPWCLQNVTKATISSLQQGSYSF